MLPPTLDPVVVRALARAFRWKRMLEEQSVQELADSEGIGPNSGNGVLRLTVLAPDVVEAILNRRQPEVVTLAGLMQGVEVEWEKRRNAAA
jgi:hypothetical protein